MPGMTCRALIIGRGTGGAFSRAFLLFTWDKVRGGLEPAGGTMLLWLVMLSSEQLEELL